MNFACQTKLQTKLVALSLLILATACAHHPYQAKPLDPAAVTAKLANKDVANSDFKAYLIKQGRALDKQGYEKDKLPFAEWGIDELTLCALYFNPKLDVAKAQL
jgi:outer membrane protein, heavy metal efflux system